MNILLHSRNQVIMKILNSCCEKLGHHISVNGKDEDFELIIRDCDEALDIIGDENKTIYLLAKSIPQSNKKFSISKPFTMSDFTNLVSTTIDRLNSPIPPAPEEEHIIQNDQDAQNLSDLGVDIKQYMPSSNQKGGDEGLELLDTLELLNIEEKQSIATTNQPTNKTFEEPKQILTQNSQPNVTQPSVTAQNFADLSDDFDLEALAKSMENSQENKFDDLTIDLKQKEPEILEPAKPIQPETIELKQPDLNTNDLDLDDLMKQFEKGEISDTKEEALEIKNNINLDSLEIPNLEPKIEEPIIKEPEQIVPKPTIQQQPIIQQQPVTQPTQQSIQNDIKIDDDILNLDDIDDLLAGIIKPEPEISKEESKESIKQEEIIKEAPSIKEEIIQKEEPVKPLSQQIQQPEIQQAQIPQPMATNDLSNQIAQDVRMGIRNGIENEVSMAVGSIFGNKSVLKEILREMNIKITISFEDKE